MTTRGRSAYDFSVLKRHLDEHGYTEVGCPRCDYMRTRGTGSGCAVAHSRRCRERIKNAMAETEEGRQELRRFAARHQVKQEPIDAPQDLDRFVDRSYSAVAPATPTPVGEEDMASPVHPTLEPIPALGPSDRPGAETLGHTEDSDEDAMSQYSAQSRAQDVGALLSLDRAEEEDFLDELKELCELSE